jgi:hypothetical protein
MEDFLSTQARADWLDKTKDAPATESHLSLCDAQFNAFPGYPVYCFRASSQQILARRYNTGNR